MNITDVGHLVSDADEGEDRMEKAARAARAKTRWKSPRFYTDAFFEDWDRLNYLRPEWSAPPPNTSPK